MALHGFGEMDAPVSVESIPTSGAVYLCKCQNLVDAVKQFSKIATPIYTPISSVEECWPLSFAAFSFSPLRRLGGNFPPQPSKSML